MGLRRKQSKAQRRRDDREGTLRLKAYKRMWRVVGRIPRGRVASYGDVAELAGYPRAARFVGRALRIARPASIPWHRVLGRDGRVKIMDPAIQREQILLLRSEGVEVDDEGKLSFSRFAWRAQHRQPGDAGKAAKTRGGERFQGKGMGKKNAAPKPARN
ncbi:MAG: MGMT family protein [Thermoplasmatota archaeon]